MQGKHLTPEQEALRNHYATRLAKVRFVKPFPHIAHSFYDNEWLYKKEKKAGKTPQYWESHLKELVKEWHAKGNVIEASLHDLSNTNTGKATAENKIAQLVSNGHILF